MDLEGGETLLRGWAVFGLVLLAACATPPTTQDRLNRALEQAAVIDTSQPASPLTPIRGAKVQLVTWKRMKGNPLTPGPVRFPRPVWGTVGGELRDFCRSFVRDAHPDSARLRERVERLLGLRDGDGEGRAMIVFEVEAAQVIRPCLDPSVATTTCPARLDEAGVAALMEKDPWAGRFIFAQILNSYVQPDGYPFTRRGFTFD